MGNWSFKMEDDFTTPDGLENEGPDRLEWDGVHLELVISSDVEDTNMLRDGLAFTERSRHRRSRLTDEERLVSGLGLDPAVVLVAPDDEVEEWRNEAVRDVVGGASLGSVLVKDQDVAPAVWLLLRSHELHLVVPEQSVQPLVLHVGEAVQRNLHSALPQ